MKSKKLFLPIIILAATVFLTAVYSVVSSIAFKPTVTQGEFPFSITYELDGETVTINDVYKAQYVRNDGYSDTKTRVYEGGIGDIGNDTTYTLKKDENGRIYLWTRFYADYLMGDPEYDYFEDELFEPLICYYDSQEIEYTDEETLAAQGVKLISFEYPTPIKNSFVFSHISILSGEVVLPALLISLLALIVTIIFVRKDKTFVRKPIDIVSTVFNFIIGIGIIPYTTIIAVFLDITGDNDHILNQMFYFVPALIIFSITASVALRRKNYKKSALIVEFIGPAVLALFILLFFISELI
jgi:hypothetical protein